MSRDSATTGIGAATANIDFVVKFGRLA